MSTDYAVKEMIYIKDLFDGRLERYGVYEHLVPGTTSASHRCLTDGGNNYLWVSGNQKVKYLTRFFPNGNPGRILAAIAETFDSEIFSEYEPQFWGFETEEEWVAAMDEIHEQHQSDFYIEIMKFVTGEPNSIGSGTNGMTMANIAKELIARTPKLASPDCEKELMERVQRIFDEDHCISVRLDDMDLKTVQLAMTDVEDLPCA